MFRRVMLRGLLSRSAVATIGIQGALFGMAHFDPIRGMGNIGLIMVLAGVGCTLGGAHSASQTRPDHHRPRDPQRHRHGHRPQRLVPPTLKLRLEGRLSMRRTSPNQTGQRPSPLASRHQPVRASAGRRWRYSGRARGRLRSAMFLGQSAAASCSPSAAAATTAQRLHHAHRRLAVVCAETLVAAGDRQAVGLRTVGTSTTSMSMSRSAIIRRMMASC